MVTQNINRNTVPSRYNFWGNKSVSLQTSFSDIWGKKVHSKEKIKTTQLFNINIPLLSAKVTDFSTLKGSINPLKEVLRSKEIDPIVKENYRYTTLAGSSLGKKQNLPRVKKQDQMARATEKSSYIKT